MQLTKCLAHLKLSPFPLAAMSTILRPAYFPQWMEDIRILSMENNLAKVVIELQLHLLKMI
ncbi:hypothetical protein CABS01_12480 [Colletotrichum abscissum]|uniref:Uncharacterized protein n=2 Tax=Colletotrichum acutatum species complex TaxID=2707335 RepID=A0A9P9XAF7_9PEZI|nr:uncharacterized protein CCOS01_15821 [Colletotrichum costaricense]XP_060396368.1 uncharacterized protein CABS01_12480 [Colletotrichum abscissum]KAI3544339.1 hypothetical protein CABS02_09741 [Colletotrichum abscissum]KAK1489899.1 hypothetical protein CABS01_12480 [Colletotrichum abscissum]KAK1508160.1 hypothetical protein CCOS01_15821 [Colletotrichum costaricense]